MTQACSRAARTAAILLSIVLAAACSPAADSARGAPTRTQTTVTPGPSLVAPTEPKSTPASTPTTAAGATGTPLAESTDSPLVVVTDIGMEPGPVPDELVDQMIQDLADRLGVSPGAISVVSAESTVWNDSSLGCPEPGMFYTQVLTPGYQVVLEAAGTHYDYRSDRAGNFRLCGG